MGHVPGLAGEAAEVDFRADDLVELRREPLGLGHEVEFGDPRAGGAQGQLQPFGVGLGLAPGLHQRRDVVGVHEIADRRLVVAAHRPVFAAEPIGLVVRALIGRFGVQDMLARDAAAVQLHRAVRQRLYDLLDAFAEVVAALEARDQLPAGAGGQEAAVQIEQGHGNRRPARRRQQAFEQRLELRLRTRRSIFAVRPPHGEIRRR